MCNVICHLLYVVYKCVCRGSLPQIDTKEPTSDLELPEGKGDKEGKKDF